MPSYEETLAGSTDTARAGITSDRAKLISGTEKAKTSGNVVKEQLARNEGVDKLSPKWRSACQAVHAAQEACESLLEANPKADPEGTFTSTMTDLIEVLTELRDGKAEPKPDVFADMAKKDGATPASN